MQYGLTVGARIPAFEAPDQTGRRRTFQSIRGRNGAFIVFVRSADWWPYCKAQLVELERNLGTIAGQGYGLCSISYDAVEILRDFAQRRGITFPMLSDPDSSIIRRFGLFNEQVPPDSRDYGIPHPGIFLVDAQGIVRERFFEDKYWNRMTRPTVFWRVGLDLSAASGGGEREHLRVRTAMSDEIVSPGNRFTLFVDVDPLPGVHAYGPDVGGGYQGLVLAIAPPAHVLSHAPVYPPAARLHLPWTHEVLTGYTHPIRVSVDISLGTRIELAPMIEAGQGLRIPGELRLQACDNRLCWAPETIALAWHVGLRAADLERVPEPLQHKARGA